MARQRVDMRLDSGLLEWADAYASERGTTRTALLESALESFRVDCERGVPELRRVAREQSSEPAESLADAAARRSELFRHLRTPDSVRGIKAKEKP